MIIAKRDDFKKLLEENPGKKFAFFEYKPVTFMGELHITMGDEKLPDFGAYAVGPPDADEENILGSPYDWNINEYDSNDLFAILEPVDLGPLADMLIEAGSDYLESNMSPVLPGLNNFGEVKK